MPRKGPKKGTSDRRDQGRRFTDTERAVLKAKAQELDVQGYNNAQIAVKLDVSYTLAGNLLREIRDDYQAAYLDSRKALVMRETAVLLDVRRRAYEAMDEIKKTGKTREVRKSTEVLQVSTKKGKKNGVAVEEVTTAIPAEEVTRTVESVDISGYLQVILDTETKLAQLWGLTELPKVVFQLNPTNQVNVFQSVLNAVLGVSADASGTTGLPVTDRPAPSHDNEHQINGTIEAPAEASHEEARDQSAEATTPTAQANGHYNPLALPPL